MARIMKNFGFSSLTLVNPTSRAHLEAIKMAPGAEEIIEQAMMAGSLDEALEPAVAAYAVSRRPRHTPKPVLNPEVAVKDLWSLGGPAGLVFGSEKLGLSNEDIRRCGAIIQIPSTEAHPSLNLAQAVAVILYEARKTLTGAEPAPAEGTRAPAPMAERRMFFNLMEEVLGETGFFEGKNPTGLLSRMEALFNRANPDVEEARIMLGALRKIKRGIKPVD